MMKLKIFSVVVLLVLAGCVEYSSPLLYRVGMTCSLGSQEVLITGRTTMGGNSYDLMLYDKIQMQLYGVNEILLKDCKV